LRRSKASEGGEEEIQYGPAALDMLEKEEEVMEE